MVERVKNESSYGRRRCSTPPAEAPPSGTMLTLPIEGMSCASCVAHVEKAIRDTPGVRDVSVKLATERAAVTAESDRVPATVAHAMQEDRARAGAAGRSSKADRGGK